MYIARRNGRSRTCITPATECVETEGSIQLSYVANALNDLRKMTRHKLTAISMALKIDVTCRDSRT
jgi:hypothetical protein